MSTIQGNVASEGRLQWLADRLGATGSVLLAEAAEALGVSEMTIRRDLAELEQRGIARRVRGGAKAIGPQPFAERHSIAARAKSRIATKLAALLPDDGVVAFDASSTVMRLTATMGATRSLTVLTNGPDTFDALQGIVGVDAELTGGRLDSRTGSLVGPIACRSASQLLVHTFFASAAALDARTGALEATLEEAEVKRSIAANAGRVVLAVDATKLDARAAAVGIAWERIDLLVTELDPRDPRLEPFTQLTELL